MDDRNYILAKNMEIKLSENHQFNVKTVTNVNLNKCSTCEGIADLVFYPCSHNTLCAECSDTKLKLCPKCKKEINSSEIYFDFISQI